MQKGKMVAWRGCEIAVEKREAKSKGEKERYTHLNAEFQRIVRRDKKIFLSDKCKEIEGNSRMGKTRDLFKKIRDTKGKFRAKMGTIKDRNRMDLTEAEDIKKRWQEYPELCIKDLHDPDNHDGVITHLEPDILEWEIKCALGSITTNKASEGDGIPAEFFQILKDDAVKVLPSICQQIWKIQQLSTGLEKVSFHSNSKKGNAKECSNYHTIALISHTGKVMLKILQGKTASTVHELRTSRHSSWILKRQRNQKSNCQHTLDHRKSKGIPEKFFCLIDCAKSFDCVDHNKLWKILQAMGIPHHLTCRSRTNS